METQQKQVKSFEALSKAASVERISMRPTLELRLSSSVETKDAFSRREDRAWSRDTWICEVEPREKGLVDGRAAMGSGIEADMRAGEQRGEKRRFGGGHFLPGAVGRRVDEGMAGVSDTDLRADRARGHANAGQGLGPTAEAEPSAVRRNRRRVSSSRAGHERRGGALAKAFGGGAGDGARRRWSSTARGACAGCCPAFSSTVIRCSRSATRFGAGGRGSRQGSVKGFS